MGSSSSRHVSHVSDRRDRGDYPPAASRDGGSAALGGSDFPDALGRTTEFQTRGGASGRERFRSRLPVGRSSSLSYVETSVPGLDPVTPVSISGEEHGTFKETPRSVEGRVPAHCAGADQYIASWASTEGSSSSTVSYSEPNGQISDTTRNVETGRLGVGLVVENPPSTLVSPEIDSVDSAEVRPPQRIASTDSRNLWLEGHPPWISRLGSSEVNRRDGISSVAGLSQSSLQNLQAVCETTVQHHRVNEMQERLRRYAGLPPSLDIHDLERRGILSAETATVHNHRAGDSSISVSRSERDAFPMESTPVSSQAWEITEEGRLIEYRHSIYSESWERHLAFHRSELHSGISSRTSSPPASSSSPPSAGGRESRRNGGRRLWDTLTRAASHRRATPTTVPLAESVADSWAENDHDHMDFRAFHSRSLDLEERRRRVRSQVWALQLLSNGLSSGGIRPCTSGGHHHAQCSCGLHSSAEESSTRASISRIIMLAEALFEVLDEIHRQSIALSRTSAPAASLPAPDNVVDAIPIRKFTKKLWEEATRCNICLVEYEDGDQVKVLPCHHEYHVACVDKWLKEIHRVCPLCRSNVCELSSMVHLPLSV
ncbi:unnamed protein product [Calypogeia fissa]